MHPTEEAQLNFWRAVISLVPAPFADSRAGGKSRQRLECGVFQHRFRLGTR